MDGAGVAAADRVLVPPAEFLHRRTGVGPATGARDGRLRRQLVKADVLAACASGVLIALLAGLPLVDIPIVVLALALGWPLAAGICGLYTVSSLRTWASGLGEAPRLGGARLLLHWSAQG